MPLPFSLRWEYPSPGQAAQPKDRVCHQTHTLQEVAAGARLTLKQHMAQPRTVWVSRPASPADCGAGGARCSAGAFTLVELLLVIAVIAVLAALLMPALATVQAKSKRVACLDNLKQSALSFQMYTADNDGKLAQNYPLNQAEGNAWVLGDMKVSVDSTNKTLIRQGKFFPYASQVALYQIGRAHV